jgi:hypothetical protein
MNGPKQRLGLQWDPLPYAVFQADRDEPMPGSRTGLAAPAAGQEPANPTTSPVTNALPANLFNTLPLDVAPRNEEIRRINMGEGRTVPWPLALLAI